jgi:glycosyltransferase involved in cell wall biosynthesis
MSTGPRSLHVISSLRLTSGGPTVSVTRLCEALNAIGAPAEIATVAAPGDEGAPPPGTAIHAFPIAWPGPLRRSPGLAEFLAREGGSFDLIHVHGLWQWPGVYGRRSAARHHRPLVISPRGMLEPWALDQRRWLKRLAMGTWEGRNLAACRMLHATSDQEAARFLALGLQSPIRVIPNGVDLPSLPTQQRIAARPTLLFLSRFHPVKAGDRLIHAWAGLWAEFPEWQLVLAGPDPDGYRSLWEALAASSGIPATSIRFLDPVAGQEKLDLLASASLLVLPSHSENFGNVVLEALASGVPVLAARGTPWASLETHGCGWWVSNDPAELQQALRTALALPGPARQAMGEAGRTWSQEFAWDRVASAMAAAYTTVLGSR